MTLHPSNSYDLSAVEQFLSNNLASTGSTQDQVAIVGDETAGMSFSELFR
jgi:phosphatidylglycerophosphatase A